MDSILVAVLFYFLISIILIGVICSIWASGESSSLIGILERRVIRKWNHQELEDGEIGREEESLNTEKQVRRKIFLEKVILAQ